MGEVRSVGSMNGWVEGLLAGFASAENLDLWRRMVYGTRVLLWMRVDIQVLGLDYCGECRYGKVCLW